MGAGRRAGVWAAVVMALLVGAGPAGAQRPAFLLAERAERPSIAVDDEGTAHVAWNERVEGGADILHYCRIPRGLTGCEVHQQLVPAEDGEARYNTDTSGPQVVLTGPESVSLLTFRYPNVVTVNRRGSPDRGCYERFPLPSEECYASSSKTWIFSSTDGGRTFGPAHVFSHQPPNGDATALQVPFDLAAGVEPGASGLGPLIATVTDTVSGGTFFASAPPEGYARTSANLGDEGPDRAYGGTVAALDDQTPVAAFVGLDSTVYVRRWNGSGPRNDIGTWGPSRAVGKGEEPHLAGGPGGVHLLYQPRGAASPPFVLRRYDGEGFGPPTTVSDGGTVAVGDLAQDDAGTLHAAWVRRDGTADALRYRFSPDGSNLSEPRTLATAASRAIYNVGLGAASDGGGWAVYSSTLSGNGTVTLVPFGTQAKRTLVDARITAIEVTQGIQELDLPRRSQATSSINGVVSYAGAPLAADNTTFVRVYANLRKALPAGSPVPIVTLRGVGTDGRALGGGGILPSSLPAGLREGGLGEVTDAQRFTPEEAYTFWIPWQWARGTVTLVAEINPQGLQPSLAECRRCRDDNTLRLANVRFQPTSHVRAFPIEIDVGSARPAGAPNLAGYFADVQAFTPLAIELTGNTPAVDISPQLSGPGKQAEREGLALQRVRDVASANNLARKDVFPFGIFPSGQGAGNGLSNGGPLFTSQPASMADDSRPLTSIGHEFHHGLGRVHADLVCGGNSNGQVGEAWPPNDDGALDGIALDTREAPPYRILSNSAPGNTDTLYDLMSYCPVGGVIEERDWISLRNWKRTIELNRPAARRAGPPRAVPAAVRPVARAAAARTLRFFAVASPGEAPVGAYVTPDGGAPTPVDPASPYRLVARGAGGAVLAEAGATGSVVHTHEGPVTLISGRVPAAGATEVALVQDGTQAAAVAASAHAPEVRIVSPGAGARVGGGPPVTLRWRSSDADGDALQAFVEYSADNGRTWRAIHSGPSDGEITLASRLLSGSRRARLRVRVQDGFREAVAVSPRFVSRGAPPQVTIDTPAPGSTVAAGTRLAVSGSALDDTGRRLGGRRLRWFDGKRRVGAGRRLLTPGLAPGRHTIALVATDAHGRRARATVPVVVAPGDPHLTTLAAPKTLGRSARRVTLRVAATFPASLRVGRQRFAVGPRARRVRVRVAPGRSLLELRLVLGAAGRRTETTTLIARS